MKTNFLALVGITVAVLTIGYSGQLFAGTDEKNDYTLTVGKGEKPSKPDPAVVYFGNHKNDVTASFIASIKKKTATGAEDVSGDVKESYYTVTISGRESVFVSCQPLCSKFYTSQTEYSTGKLEKTFHEKVDPVIRSRQPGKKTVTLSVRVIMNDDTELSTSETITFVVSFFRITVYSYVGNMLEAPSAEADYYYADINAIYTVAIYAGISVFGHASFRIGADVYSTDFLPWVDKNYINKSCGFSIAKNNNQSFLNQIRAYPASHQSPTLPGRLIRNDGTGGKNKDFGLLVDATVNAMNQAKSIYENPPAYVFHSYNCVDATLAVANAARVDLGNCRHNVLLEDTSTGSRHMEMMSLPDELANALE